jgi:hypothetical protein
MPSAPQSNDRFNLRYDPDGMTIVFDGRVIPIAYLQGLAVNEPSIHNDFLVNLREAGMWFTDIARLLSYPSASSASASYVRVCRQRNVQPIVRSARGQNSRFGSTDLQAVPEFLSRDGFDSDVDFGFGVELECVGITYNQAANTIQQLGFNCEYEGYTHDGVRQWKVVRDSSIGSGPECVSRVLHGADGLREMRQVQLALKNAGAKTTSSCGMHTHIGVEHLSNRQKAVIIKMHQLFQGVFDTVCNPSRRNGRYSRHRGIDEANRHAHNWSQANHSRPSSRFYALNLDSYFKYGTFEMRAYQGCLNPAKASAWIQLNMDFMHWCGRFASATTHALGVDSPMVSEVLNVQGLNEMPLTLDVILNDRPAEVIARGRRNFVATDEAVRIMQEWCGEHGFIKNAKVKQILQAEVNRINRITTTQGEQ